jgi:hypothetical protein
LALRGEGLLAVVLRWCKEETSDSLEGLDDVVDIVFLKEEKVEKRKHQAGQEFPKSETEQEPQATIREDTTPRMKGSDQTTQSRNRKSEK